MDSFTLNKIAGAVLGTCLIGMGIGIVADGIYTPEKPKKPGYALPMPKAKGAKTPSEMPLSVLLAKADPKKGEADAKVCGACHNFVEGAGAKVGPDLYGVVDRDKGSAKGFDYSAGMKKKGGKWTYQDIFEFIKKPSAYVQGTKMSFGGEESPEKRAEIIAYLRTLSKKPVPLPKVSEADKKAAEGGSQQAEGGASGGENQLIKLIGAADPKKGEGDAKICTACHNFKKGEGAKVGPDLYGVVDREKGSQKGFDYSPGMKKKGGKWTYADLNQFLTKPSAYVQGTKMGFGGEADEKKRASIIAYLRSNADKPEPLPKASAGGGEKKEAGGKAGGGDFAKMVAAADPKKGQSNTTVCGACHNFKKGEGAKVGPDLYGVVDRDKGSVKGFDYSAGMKKKGGKWTYDDLNQFLTKPSAYVQGTKMGFGGEADEKKRAAIVAYLRSNADKPAPLPGAGGEKKADAASAKPDEKKSEDKKPADKAAASEKKTEAAPAKPDDKKAAKPDEKKPDDKAAAPEKKTEAAPAKPDDKKAAKPDEKKPDDKAAAPEKKTEAAPAKPDDKKAAKPDEKKPDDKAAAPEKKTEAAPAKPDDKKAEAKPEPAPAPKAASEGPEPYSAPNPEAPTESAKPAAAPSGDAAAAPESGKADAATAGAPEPYAAPAPGEAPSSSPEPAAAPTADASSSGTGSSDPASGGGPEPYSAPTPADAKEAK